jgi:NAD(P)-dependent dehydrogenase (short-subunit alcohol dehydrogenase family)|tara:strand:- start:2260 stop:3012 length:753 start_codon:yes stop_codon:yes gene_type:complete
MVEKVALVTGAGAGIGRACALALAKEGYRLILAGRRREPLESCAEEIAKWGVDVIVVPTDVGKVEAVAALFLQVESTFGRIDLLFNNAGTGTPPVPIDELSFQQWQRVVDVNLTGTFLCAQAAFKLMKKQLPAGGRIINNGSVSAISPRPNSAPYTATKHAITGLTKSLSLDGREHNIACGQIDIGNALTDMTQVMKSGVPQANGKIAPEPTMDVDDVARSVVFMAGLPLESNVQFMTVMATAMPLIGRG